MLCGVVVTVLPKNLFFLKMEKGVCSECKKELTYDKGNNYEDQTNGALFCGSCGKDKDGVLLLNMREARDAGIVRAATRMRVKSSTPNRRAKNLYSREQEEK